MTKFLGSLKEFQIEGREFALSTPYHINNFQAGLGKTITSLSVACSLEGRALIVCPAFLKANWVAEIGKFCPTLQYDIVSYASFTKIDMSVKYSIIIADEVHALKNKDAKRSEAFRKYLAINKPPYFMGLTGTPVSNRNSEFWHLLQLCYLGGKYPEFKPYHRLYYKFCNTFSYERSFEVNGFTVTRFDGVKNREKLKALIRPILIRRRADKVLDLPPEVESNIVGGSKKYDKDLKEALKLFKADPNDPAYMSLKASNALAKVDTTVKAAKELIEQGNRPLIFTCHVASAKEIAKKLKCNVITGNVKAGNRQLLVDAFNQGKQTALVATIGSAATGFNITSTNYTIFNDLDFVPANIEQAKKRTLRIGQTKTCFYYYIFTSEFDQSIQDMLKRKNNDINKVFN